MARGKGELWAYYYEGEKQNSSHFKAYCLGCIKHHAPAHIKANVSLDITTLDGEQWFKEACEKAGNVLGTKSAMTAHLIGGERPCQHASEAAKKKAGEIRKAEKKKGVMLEVKRGRGNDSGGEEGDTEGGGSVPASKKTKGHRPCQEAAEHIGWKISTNLPDHWVEDPEVITLFLMFRAQAGDVLPSAKMLGGRLLDEEHERVEKEVKKAVKGKDVVLTCDGVKDISKNTLTGPHLIDLYNSTPDKKDKDSMCESFEKMIDAAEKVYGCAVVGLGTDNDGGSRAGRELLGKRRPWVFTFPCLAHQGQLILCDYFKVNEKAQETSEEATDLVGWINNHGRIRDIFNQVQSSQTNKILAYLVANLTRWTTHVISFHRLEELKKPLRVASLSHRDNIIAAQVGAEKNAREVQELTAAATRQLDPIDNNQFWSQLSTVVEDLEPICYATNICQSDHAGPDVVLLAFVGVFLHFKNHSDRHLSLEMTKRLERRWKSFDQNLMIGVLILNPYERLDRFGPNANANAFSINALITNLYIKYASRPLSEFLDPDEKEAAEEQRRKRVQAVSSAVTQYLAMTGPFTEWPGIQAGFEKIHGKDPIKFWETMSTDGRTVDLANFAVTLFSMVLNTAGNERDFSKIRNTIKQGHYRQGLKDRRKPRKNHDEERLSKLLEVPAYAEAIEEPDPDQNHDSGSFRSQLITNRKQWRREFVKWGEEARKQEESQPDDLSDGEDDELDNVSNFVPALPTGKRTWLPRSLALLFGGKVVQEEVEYSLDHHLRRRQTRRQGWSEEALYMELPAQEEQDEIPDDGALEGSGDEYGGI
ncbi:hypothetical protein D9758_014844 [Tetrapyrgos nigripes]|uniref:DUF659 domain-containing protein n=1 Tax=Tetrapyrgos nigripes TaxID=182062 RepID=A0A8H5CTK7_9AGAR|nr:hypothetical protein D9758_014844 [Tetrapyrgos nigripes]